MYKKDSWRKVVRVDRREIAVVVKKKSVLRFLEDFFQNTNIYNARYFNEPSSVLKHIGGPPPSAVVSEDCLLHSFPHEVLSFPTVSIIGGDIQRGIETSSSCKVKNYLYKPFLGIDLEYKLESAIKEKDTLEKMENDVRELEAVVDLMQLISDTLDPKELLFRIVKKIAEIIPVTRCSMISADRPHKAAIVMASFEDPHFTGVKLSLRKYPEIVKALSSKKPVVIKDVKNDPLMKSVRDIVAPLGIRSILVIPIFLHKKIIGTLFLRTSRAGHTFSDNEIRLLNSLATAAANTLHTAFLFEQVEGAKERLEKLSITDYLTSIYNIRYFYHRIIEEFSRCQRYAMPVSCLMFDVDYFKKINDHYGHQTGDVVLKELAQLLKRQSRKSDVLARYGGEEFIMLLPHTSAEGAATEAERIRMCVKNHRFKCLKNIRALTVSVGVASFPHEKVKTHEDIISFADNALYTAKSRGRDRVVVFE